MTTPLTRREALATAAALSLPHPRSAPLLQGAASWCWKKRGVSLDRLCREGARLGMHSVDIVAPEDWKKVRDHGLVPSIGRVGGMDDPIGPNDPDHHDRIIRAFETFLPRAAAEGVPGLILFFGNRVEGMTRGLAIENSAACLRRIAPVAEECGVTIQIELLNSRVDHPRYIGDNTAYCLDVIRTVASPRVKLLYDIYHAQIMEGDIIRTIRIHHRWIGHYHTGGNPGRSDLGDTQELNYRAISNAVRETGFKGYFVHEFIPKKDGDPIRSLRNALELCGAR